MVKVKGFVVSVPDLQQLVVLSSTNDNINRLLRTIPYGSNYIGIHDGIHELSRGYRDTKKTLNEYVSLENIDHSCKIVIMETQYDLLKTILKEVRPKIVFKAGIRAYDYITGADIRGYEVKLSDFLKIPVTDDSIRLFNCVPIGSNFGPTSACSYPNSVLDNTFPGTSRSIYNFIYTCPCINKLPHACYRIYIEQCHYLLLSDEQFAELNRLIEKYNYLKDINGYVYYSNSVEPIKKNRDCCECAIL